MKLYINKLNGQSKDTGNIGYTRHSNTRLKINKMSITDSTKKSGVHYSERYVPYLRNNFNINMQELW